MEFLDKLVIPQPDYNLVLLNYLLIFGMIIFLIYSGILIGSALLSVYFKSNSDGKLDNKYHILSKEYIDIITRNKSYAFGLGIIPFLAIIVSYTQLLHKIDNGVVVYLTIGFLLYLCGIYLIYNYKKSLHLNNIFSFVNSKIGSDDSNESREFNEVKENNFSTYSRTGFWGVVVMLIAMLITIGTMSFATDSKNWVGSNFFIAIFSVGSIVHYIHFLTIALAMASISYLFNKFYWEKDIQIDAPEYFDFTKNLNLWIALITTILQPLFIIFNVMSTPTIALSGTLFLLAVLAMITILVIAQLLYAMLKSGDMVYVKYTYLLFIIAFALIAAKEKTAFNTANQNHLLVLNDEYEVHHKAFMASMGIETEVVNASDIYTGRCMACHKAEDTPGVAPAHKSIIGKYLNNREALVKFIMSPVKVNPAYPNMPNQGLKPKEAQAVADYLLEKYGGKKAETPAKPAEKK